jgi:hypothetical protein
VAQQHLFSIKKAKLGKLGMWPDGYLSFWAENESDDSKLRGRNESNDSQMRGWKILSGTGTSYIRAVPPCGTEPFISYHYTNYT